MEMLLSSSSSSIHPLFSNQVKRISNVKGLCKLGQRVVQCSCSSSSSSSKSIIENGFCRRDLILLGASSSLLTFFPSSESEPFGQEFGDNSSVELGSIIHNASRNEQACCRISKSNTPSVPKRSTAEEEFKMASFADNINGYSYKYPIELPTKKSSFKWVESRKPERYSSAAPLSPDARQRIVSERVDFIDNLIISVSIGPPNPLFIKSMDKSTWRAKDVADSVLSDKSALRVTSSQRKAESSVLDAHASEVDGVTYWYYEYLIRKSPTKDVSDSNLYRHYVASTYERDGFLFSLNASTLGKQWDEMGPYLEKTIASFRVLPATDNYVPPFKDPWRFW